MGQELGPEDVQNMLRHSAAHVLGWASGAGRGSRGGGALTLADFRKVVDHFRVT